MRYSILFFSFILIFFNLTNGQNTFISGKAPGAEGLKIKLLATADYISGLQRKLDEYIIDENGNFKLKTSINETIFVQLQIGFIKGEMYLEAGKSYTVNIEKQNYKLDDMESPFLSAKRLELEINNNQANELNTQIDKFNVLSNKFSIKNYYALYQRRDKTKLDTLIVNSNEIIGNSNNLFLKNYVRYRIAGVEQMGRLKSRKKLFAEYIMDQPVLYNHVEYMYFFNEFYEKFFFNGMHYLKNDDIKRFINVEKNYLNLLDSLGRDSLVKNEVIRELVFLKGMKELYYSKSYNNNNIIDILSRFANRTKFQEHKKIALNLIESFNVMKINNKAPDFKLQDINGNTFNLASFTGKITYICFFTTWCEGCKPETEAITELKKKYGDKVNFVFISADKQSLNLHYFLEKYKYDSYFLYPLNNTDVFEDYGIRSFPVFVLLDQQGKILYYPALKPSEGIETIFNQLLKKDSREN